jgi:hypothetical protein
MRNSPPIGGRRPVIARRICHQNRSFKGARTQAILMTIFRTAELQGENHILEASDLVKEQIYKNILLKLPSKKVA